MRIFGAFMENAQEYKSQYSMLTNNFNTKIGSKEDKTKIVLSRHGLGVQIDGEKYST